MFRILIVDDDEDLLDDLKHSFDDKFPGSSIETAMTVNDGHRLIREAVNSRWPYHAAVLDFKLPRDKGLNEEVDESLCHEIRQTRQNTLVAHITSYVHDPQIIDHLRNSHSERTDPWPMIIDKTEDRWIPHLLKKMKAYLYSNRIEARMDKLFGSYTKTASAGTPSLGRGGPDNDGSITMELATLCREIATYWEDLDEELQSRIEHTFDVDTKSDPIRISLL
jgi:CheY-like chemotaxis protein